MRPLYDSYTRRPKGDGGTGANRYSLVVFISCFLDFAGGHASAQTASTTRNRLGRPPVTSAPSCTYYCAPD